MKLFPPQSIFNKVILLSFFSFTAFSQILPPLIIGSSHTICTVNDSVVLFSQGCFQGTIWSTGSTLEKIIVKNTGIYSAKCIENGIESVPSKNFQIFSNPSGNLLSSNGEFCQNISGKLLTSNLPIDTYSQFYLNNTETFFNSDNSINPLNSGSYFYKAKNIKKGNWILSNSSANSKINDLLFINQNIGFLVDSLGEIYKSIDSGINWSIKLFSNAEILKIFNHNGSILWACGKKGGLYKSIDGGNIWSKINILPSNTSFTFNDIYFTDSNTGWITCNNGIVYKTTNSGLSWSPQFSIGLTYNSFLKFFDPLNGQIIYSNGAIYQTNNGGLSWNNKKNTFNDNITSVQFLDSLNLLIFNKYGTILKSENGGFDWKIIAVPGSSPINNSTIFETSKGWACGKNGTIYFTESTGSFWNNFSVNSSNNFTKIFFLNDSYGWIVDDKGKIFRFEDTEEYYCPSNVLIINPSPESPNIHISECLGFEVQLEVTNCQGNVYWDDGTSGLSKIVSANGIYFAHCQFGSCFSSKAKFSVNSVGANPNINISSGTHCLATNPQLEVINNQNNINFNWFKDQFPLNEANLTITPLDTGKFYLKSFKVENSKTWKWINKKIPDATFLNAQFVSNKVAWGANTVGDLFKTEDGGKTWFFNNFEGFNFQDSKFFNSNSGIFSYIKNSTSYIFKTQDGGENWISYQLAPSQTYVQYLYFINENIGWAVGTNESIVKTIDGGKTWNVQRSIINASHLNSVYFINENEGWASGLNGLILHTVDGGNLWNKITSNINTHIADTYFKNSSDGYLITPSSGFYETKNGGQTWTRRNDIFGFESVLRKFKFIDEKNGYLIGSSFYLLTNDGGKSWKLFNNENTRGNTGGFDVIDDNNLIFAKDNGIQISHDGGSSWNKSLSDQEEEILKINFFDDFYASRIRTTDVGVTINGGNSWMNFKCNNPRQIFKTPDNTLWLCTLKFIYFSKDKGKTWSLSSLSAPSNKIFLKIYFLDNYIGFVIGGDKVIYKTIDGGITWTNITVFYDPYISYSYNDIVFLNYNVGIISTSNGTLFKSIDQGLNWYFFKTVSTSSLNQMQFIDENIGWVCDDQKVFRTFDGGQNWLSTNYQSYFNSFEFTDSQNGYSSIYRSIYKTSNGGTTWELLSSPYYNYRCLDINNNKLFIAGSNSNILKFSFDGDDLCPSNIITIIKPKTPVITSNSSIICNDVLLPIKASNCNGDNIWNNGLIGNTIQVNQTGNYFTKCQLEGCESDQSNIINLTKDQNCINIQINPDLIYVCPKDQIQINVIGCQNGTITWSNGLIGSQIIFTFLGNTILEAYCSSGGNSKISVLSTSDTLINPNQSIERKNIIRANNTIISNIKFVSLNYNQDFQYVSGNDILLQPGFEINAKNVGVFKTEIKKCLE